MLMLWTLTAPTPACGGFFCSPAISPIDQAAEDVVLALGDGVVEMHVEISYTGTSEDFAWVVPVPAEPELFLSSAAMFDELQLFLAPTFTARWRTEGRCGPLSLGCHQDLVFFRAVADSDFSATVLDAERIGPFETVTLRAASADDLLGWLDEHGYDLPADLGPLLAPYVAEGSAFVALRLAAEAEVGDIEPIGLRFRGDEAALPIRLTSVAAAPDMPIRVTVFAAARAVPTTYLEVTLNEAAIDWASGGANYPTVVRDAVDLAGGQAFVTEYAGSTRLLADGAVDQALRDLARRFPVVTRLTTTMSPDEMTVDPAFALDPDLPDVPKDHRAALVTECRGDEPSSGPPRHVDLEDGRISWLNPRSAPSPGLAALPALRVIDHQPGAAPEVLVDFSADVDAELARAEARWGPQGCGCSARRVDRSFALLVLIALWLRRRATPGR